MPSLCGSAEAAREWFRAFTAHSFLTCRPLRPRGVRHRYPETSMPTLPSPNDHRLGTPVTPAIRSTRAVDFVASLVRFRYGLPGCSPPWIRLERPAFGDFYFQAFNGSVSLSVAGYNYNSGWISFCWRDLHPLEWQLASLHGQKAKYSLRADVFRCSPDSGHRRSLSANGIAVSRRSFSTHGDSPCLSLLLAKEWNHGRSRKYNSCD